MIAHSKAIVLNKKDYSNTSLIVDFYTLCYGKVTCLIKGAKRKDKYNSKFDLFSLNEIIFYKNNVNKLAVLSECNLLENYQSVRQDLVKMGYGLYFVELISLSTEQFDPNESLFYLFLDAFAFLSQEDSDTFSLEKFKLVFELRLLSISGLKPRIDSCLVCDRKILKIGWFSKRCGGLLCEDCKKEDKSAILLSCGSVLSINRLIKEDIYFFKKLEFTAEVSKELKNILSEFLDYHFGKRAKSADFLHLVENMKI